MKRNMKYKSMNIKQKLAAIQEVDNGKSMKEVAEKYGVPPNTLSTIYKKKGIFKNSVHHNPSLLQRKRMRTGKFPVLDNAVKSFVFEARNNNVSVNGNIIKEKAKQYGLTLDCDGFQASNGWLDGLKKRTGMKWRCLTGDAAGCLKEVAEDWINTTLKPLIRNYNENDIFNGDETGFFYKCLPGKSFILQGDNCKKGKYSKERITIMLCTNMSGTEKIRPLVIGKSGRPHCFKNVKSLPVDYEFNRKAWMNSSIFEKWLMKLDVEFVRQHREVLFFFDNCSAHKNELQFKLNNIRLEFFPPNLTAILQPMDMGIIRCLKVNYRNEVVKEMLEFIERKENCPKITLLNAINRISKIWDFAISSTIIKNCFKKSGFYDDHSAGDDNMLLAEITQETERNFNSLKLISDFKEGFADYVDCDINVICSDVMTDEDIIENVRNQSISTNNTYVEIDAREVDEANLSSDLTIVTNSELHDCVKKLRNGMLQRHCIPQIFFNLLNEMEVFLVTD